MIQISFEDAAAYARPDASLSRYEAGLYWRASRLVRRASTRGATPDAYIATCQADLLPGSALLANLEAGAAPATRLLEGATGIRYTPRLRSYEVELPRPCAVVLLPRDLLPDDLRSELRLGYVAPTAVPFSTLQREVTVLRAQGAQVRWARVRHAAGQDTPDFDLHVRLRRGAESRELRTRLPRPDFPDGQAVARFLAEAVGEVPYVA